MKKTMPIFMFLLALLPGVTCAHTGTGATTGFIHGFSHPIYGIDHLLAMVAVGLWAIQMGGKAKWFIPGSFVITMAIGGILGFTGTTIPFVEQGILLSLLILGVFITAAFKLPLPYSGTIVALFALFHGFAHGAEMPETIGAVSYAAGFAGATAILHLTGIGLGSFSQQVKQPAISRFAGGIIAISGVCLSFL